MKTKLQIKSFHRLPILEGMGQVPESVRHLWRLFLWGYDMPESSLMLIMFDEPGDQVDTEDITDSSDEEIEHLIRVKDFLSPGRSYKLAASVDGEQISL